MKTTSLVILSLITLTNLFGQVQFGLKAGANNANISIDASVHKKAIWGFYVGGIHQQVLSEKLLLQSELLYSRKGFNAPSVMFADEQKVILNYINVPVLLGYQFSNHLTTLLGPEFGLLTKAKSKFATVEFDQTGSYNKFDVGLDLSINFKPTKNSGLDLRYNYGLKSLEEMPIRDRNNEITFAKSTDQVLQFGLSYFFGFVDRKVR